VWKYDIQSATAEKKNEEEKEEETTARKMSTSATQGQGGHKQYGNGVCNIV